MQEADEENAIDELFEEDIALTAEQAEGMLRAEAPLTSPAAIDSRRRVKRKLAEPMTKRWNLPIAYTFDGTHSK